VHKKLIARVSTAPAFLSAILVATSAHAELSAEELAKIAQNPIGTVPMGGGVGKIFHFGKLPVNTSLVAYYNVARPEFAPNWNLRFQVQLMFPK
jgi:hypothetical protein